MACLVRDLILHLHATEPDPEAVILVFLPTYRALLLQHNLLTQPPPESASAAVQGANPGGAEALDVFALHSSVDIDEALEAIQGPRVAGRRRVVLATNCCESSVTLPNVKHVVDSCTTNQVRRGLVCGGLWWKRGGGDTAAAVVRGNVTCELVRRHSCSVWFPCSLQQAPGTKLLQRVSRLSLPPLS